MLYPSVVGGVQLRNWELAKRLTRMGHDVTLFGMKHWAGDDVITREGVRLHGVCAAKELYTKGRRAVWPPIYFSAKVLAPLLRDRFDLIDVANMPYFSYFPCRIAAAKHKAPLVVTWHEVWGEYWLEYLGNGGVFARMLEAFCARQGDAVIAVSRMVQRELGGLGGAQRASLIPNGIDFRYIQAVPPSTETSDVIYVGRLIKEKNVNLLIKAIGRLVPRIPEIRCLIVGSGPEESGLGALIRESKLENSIQMVPFLQQRSDVFSYLKASKVFVLPSSREGFGIVAVEANACGLPVVTTAHPRNAAQELIRDGENGFVCAFSEESIADTIASALARGAVMKKTCEDFALGYDWDPIASALEEVYMETAQIHAGDATGRH